MTVGSLKKEGCYSTTRNGRKGRKEGEADLRKKKGKHGRQSIVHAGCVTYRVGKTRKTLSLFYGGEEGSRKRGSEKHGEKEGGNDGLTWNNLQPRVLTDRMGKLHLIVSFKYVYKKRKGTTGDLKKTRLKGAKKGKRALGVHDKSGQKESGAQINLWKGPGERRQGNVLKGTKSRGRRKGQGRKVTKGYDGETLRKKEWWERESRK